MDKDQAQDHSIPSIEINLGLTAHSTMLYITPTTFGPVIVVSNDYELSRLSFVLELSSSLI